MANEERRFYFISEEGEKVLEEIIAFIEKNRTSDWQKNVAFLREKGRLRLLEAGRDLRVYQFVSFNGERLKVRFFWDGKVSHTEIISRQRVAERR